jgi:hypothetical protein
MIIVLKCRGNEDVINTLKNDNIEMAGVLR